MPLKLTVLVSRATFGEGAGYEFEHFRAGSESIWKGLGLKGGKWSLILPMPWTCFMSPKNKKDVLLIVLPSVSRKQSHTR